MPMKWFLYSIMALGGFSPLQAQVGDYLAPVQGNKVSNDSGLKLIVRGRSNQIRMSIASIASGRIRAIRKLLGEFPDYEGERPLFIDLYDKGQSTQGAERVVTRVSSFEGQEVVIEMAVDVRTQLEHEQVLLGATEIALYRRGLEGVAELGDGQYVEVPAWLVYGLDEALAWQLDSSKRRIYEHLLANPDIIPLDQVLLSSQSEYRSLDSVKRKLYRASSCALVMSLLEQDGGAKAFTELLSDVVTFEGEVDILLRKHFPDMGVGSNAIEKVWSLQVAMMAAPKLIDTFSMEETEKVLTSSLSLMVLGEDQRTQLIPLEEYNRVVDLNEVGLRQSVNGMRAKLFQLSNRCHPVYRPVIYGYLTLADDISAGRLEGLDPRLVNLELEREQMLSADLRCRDYLDWYQITRARNVTGDFSGYMKLKDSLEYERAQRKDAVIDVYLDRVQSLMTR